MLNLVLREAVTMYEVYLEKALYEVVDFKVGQTVVGERSPDPKVRDAAIRALLGVERYPQEVAEIFALRNLLTHLRGELRTERLQARYGSRSDDGFPEYSVQLNVQAIMARIDMLATAARQVDVVVHRVAWGTRSIPEDERQRFAQAAPWLFRRPERQGG